MTATGPKAGTGTRTYCYDAAGNTKRRTTDAGATQTLTWDTEGRLATVTEGTNVWTSVYDNDGTRLIERTPNGDTLYLPDGTEIKKLTGGQLESTRYYSHNGVTISVRNAGNLYWIAPDHHGTRQAQIRASDLYYPCNRSMPFGEPRGTQNAFVGTKGFVGGYVDTTGLVHMGAREYDSTIGRFISIDPEIDAFDPQTLHGYLYGNNNPVTWSDPTGRSILGSIGKGLVKGWVRVNQEPIAAVWSLASNTYKVAESNVTTVVNGDKSVSQALTDVSVYGVKTWATLNTAATLAPITTAAEMWEEGFAAYHSIEAGDWEGAVEHSYVASADAAYTVMTVIGVGELATAASAPRAATAALEAADAAQAAGVTKATAESLVLRNGRVYTEISGGKGSHRNMMSLLKDLIDGTPIGDRAGWHGACALPKCLARHSRMARMWEGPQSEQQGFVRQGTLSMALT